MTLEQVPAALLTSGVLSRFALFELIFMASVCRWWFAAVKEAIKCPEWLASATNRAALVEVPVSATYASAQEAFESLRIGNKFKARPAEKMFRHLARLMGVYQTDVTWQMIMENVFRNDDVRRWLFDKSVRAATLSSGDLCVFSDGCLGFRTCENIDRFLAVCVRAGVPVYFFNKRSPIFNCGHQAQSTPKYTPPKKLFDVFCSGCSGNEPVYKGMLVGFVFPAVVASKKAKTA